MLALLSPSKTQDFLPTERHVKPTTPDLLGESEILARQLRTLSQAEVGKLMKISDKLAALNHERFQEFSTPFTPANAKPAALAFKGDVYDGLDSPSLSDAELERAQHSIRILSGLYGVLRPLDLIQPYRLEMGTKLNNPRGKDLYAFWGERITDTLNRHLKAEQTDTVVNLASNEYFSAVQPGKLAGKLVTIHFKEEKAGKLRVIGLFAKRARGMMARFIAKENITGSEGLKNFSEGGYRFQSALSNDVEFVFARKQP